MKVPGLVALAAFPAPWTWVDGPHPLPGILFDGSGAPIPVHLWSSTGRLMAAVPDMHEALVVVTEALVQTLCLPAGVAPEDHAAVRLALAAVAKANRREG